MEHQIPIRFRPPIPQDKDFLFNSFLKSYRGSPETQWLTNNVFYDNFKTIWTNILLKSNVLVACNPEDVTQIYGYIVYEVVDGVFIAHYVYVKYAYRKLKVGVSLLSAVNPNYSSEAMVCTFATHNYPTLSKKYSVLYNPFYRNK